MTLDVSKDGQYVTWAAPAAGEIFVLHMVKTLSGSDSFELYGVIPVSGWYPIISPDARFLAVQTRMVFHEKGKASLAIQYFDLKTLRIISPATVILEGVYMNALDRIQERDGSNASTLGAATIERLNPNHAILTDWIL